MKKTLIVRFCEWFGARNYLGLGRAGFSGPAVAVALMLIAGPAFAGQLTGHVPAAAATATHVGPLAATNHMRLAIGLPLRDKEGLTNLLRDLYNPGSTNYHHFLTPSEFTDRFSPTEDDYNRVIAFANAHGLRVTKHSNRMLVAVDGDVPSVEDAFQVKMHVYHHPTESRDFFAPDVNPTIPEGLAVTNVAGLDNYFQPRPLLYPEGAAYAGGRSLTGSGPGGNYIGDDFRTAYVPGVPLTGAGQTVGLLQFDSGYFTNDIAAYETLTGRTNVPVIPVLLDGYNGGPGIANDEVSLDIEMVLSMAPGVSKIFVYEGDLTDSILNRMATDDVSSQLSASWGYSIDATSEQIFQEFAAQGQSFFNASGDSDAYVGPIIPPSDDPNITSVGGTTLFMNGTASSYLSEKVWNWGNGIGSSGGISTSYEIPIYQQGVSMANNQGSTIMRNMPDVAMTGDNVWVIFGNGSSGSFGGTSCACPLWAAFTALVNQQAVQDGTPSVGFLNPAIYNIGLSAGYSLSFHDCTVGDNTWPGSPNQFFGVAGYDLCTGWGSPTGSNLINTLSPPAATPVLVVVTNFISGGNGNGVIDFNECNQMLVSVANIGTSNATTVIGTLTSSTTGVAIGQATVAFPNIPVGTEVTNFNPFQISTAPDFVCGTPVSFTLTLKSDQVTSTRGFTVVSGSPGAPVRFDSTNFVFFTGTGTSPLTVSNVTTALKEVSVSVFIQDEFDFGITLQLVGPDGTTVLLSQNNGSSGQNYGQDCSDGNRTTFDDNALINISSGFAPFVGTYQPQTPLSVFAGKAGTNVNGTWQLQATDAFGFPDDVIDCWSLNLEPAGCTDGGGQCPGVDLALGMTGFPNPVQVQSNIVYTINVTNNGPDTATGVTVNHRLPPSVSFVSAVSTPGFCTETGGIVTANLGTLAVGGTASVTVTVTAVTAGTNFSTASVGCQQPELNPINNSATVTNIIRSTTADLSVGLAAAPNPVLLDGVLVYTATVVNHGSSDATNVMVTNTLPLNVSLISFSSSQGSISSSSNLIIAALGNLSSGSNAIITMTVQPLVLGVITATSSVSSDVRDPFSGNNTSSTSVTVGPAADLSLTLTGPSSVILGSNITWQATVINLGPSPATGVTLKDTLPANVNFVSATNSSPGASQPSFAGGIVTCVITNLALNASTTMTIVGSTATGSLSNSAPVTVIDSASAAGGQADSATNNNGATLSTLVTFPTINVVNAGYLLEAESFRPTNGMIESGETVTVLLKLQNLGNINTSNSLTATLLATNGVIPSGSQVQNYGLLPVGGSPVGELFTFTAGGTNGGTITATLQLANGSSNLPATVKYTFNVAAAKSFTNANNIIIPDVGAATPYPSSNIVSGVVGLTGKVTVNFTNVFHTFSDDVDMLLVGPGGQSVLLMSHAGGVSGVTNIPLTFDDGATNADGSTAYLPTSSRILPGSYAPSAYGSVSFPTNAPAPPYSTNLSIFDGLNPNGAWRLFVVDSHAGDQGEIFGGWSLNIVSGSSVNPIVDLAVTGKASPSPVIDGANLTYIFTITNNGPNVANVVTFSNLLPANAIFVSATNSAHVPMSTNSSGAVLCTLTNFASSSNLTVTIVVIPTTAGQLSSVATVGGSDSDPNQSNNSATVLTTASAPSADVGVVLTGPTNGVVTSNLTYVITVTNNGPGVALGVVVTNPLNGLTMGINSSSSIPGVSPFSTNGSAVCNLGNLNPNSSATVTLLLTASQAGTITNIASATTASIDANSTNNSSSIVTVINAQVPVIVAAGAQLIVAEPDGSIAPGEHVTLSLQLANIGTADTANLTGVLVSSNGVLSPSGPQNYGVLAHGGPAKGMSYSFTSAGGNNAINAAVLQLTDGTNNLGSVTFNFPLPGSNTFVSSSSITIPDHGVAAPYPASITISNTSGVVTKATVTLSNLTHQFPNDVEVMVVAPTGQNVVLMAGTGGSASVTNVTLIFDDGATNSLPSSTGVFAVGNGQIVSGTYRPSDYGVAQLFPSPAPGQPYASTLSAVNGSPANGTWSLYVFDNTPGDDGNIAQGWSLSLETVSPVAGASDLGVGLIRSGGSVGQGQSFNFTVAVTNKGPSDASNVSLTNTLPTGVSVTGSSVGFTAGANNTWVFNLGPLGAGTTTNFTTTLASSVIGTLVDSINVGADQTDLNPVDNVAQSLFTVSTGPRLAAARSANGPFTLTLTLTGPAGTYDIQASTNVLQGNWNVIGVLTNTSGSAQFTDTNTTGVARRFYRAVVVGP